jgi:hypothetical protein
MKRQLKKIFAGTLTLALAACGSAGTSNDQGVSFTLYGMFRDSACTQGLSGLAIQLSTDAETNGSGVGGLASVGLQNNLAQAIRTRRAFMKYYVEGAQVQPPTTSQPLGSFLGPGTKTPNSSLPDSISGGTGEGAAAGLASVGCSEIDLVPAEILSYLNFNKDTLPELPYKMRVEVTVTGIGTAGDEYATNPIDVFVEVLEDNIITPSPADGGGAAAIDESGVELLENLGENSEIIPIEDVE